MGLTHKFSNFPLSPMVSNELFIIMCKQVFVLQSVEWFLKKILCHKHSSPKISQFAFKNLMAFHFRFFTSSFIQFRSSVILTHPNWEQNVWTEVKVIFRIYFWTWEISVFVMDNVHNVHKMCIFFSFMDFLNYSYTERLNGTVIYYMYNTTNLHWYITDDLVNLKLREHSFQLQIINTVHSYSFPLLLYKNKHQKYLKETTSLRAVT